MLLEQAHTDWLSTKPVFYNENTGAISYCLREVIDYKNLKFNGEGLRNYLKFGYTVFGQTIVDGVRCLDHSSQIVKNADGSLTITENEDIAKKLWNPGRTNGSEVFEEIIEATRSWADSLGNCGRAGIVLPLSGGFDSRLLAYSLKGRENVHAYSYGVSARQKDSFEAVKAGLVAKACDLSFKQVDIDDFLKEEYLDRWYKMYGPSVHLHGMYQMDFYDGVLNDLNSQTYDKLHLLSGIVGDVWAGNVVTNPINSPDELGNIGYTHGINGDVNAVIIKGGSENAERYYEKYKDDLKDPNWRVLSVIRIKMMLLRYLLTTPESMGMTPWSPFIDPKICIDILNLDWSLKTDRVWQQREFDKINLNIGWEKDKCDYNMVVDVENVLNNRPRPLDVNLLSQVVKKEYVERVNRDIAAIGLRALPAKPRTVANVYNKFVKKYNNKIDRALIDYQMLGSIERLLIEAENS